MKNVRHVVAIAIGPLVLSTTALAPSAAAASSFATYDAIVALDNCSGSVVRLPGAVDTDKAVVLTNGHCLPTMPQPNTYQVDTAANRRVTVLGGNDAHSVTNLTLDRLLYATMTGTDVALYRATTTYGQLKSASNVTARPLSTTHPVDGTSIDVPSGYWKQHYSCGIDGFVYRLDEGGYSMKDSIRYSTCTTPHGSSGSPIVETSTGSVIGINNTGNDDGARCTLNNPCEVDEAGRVTVEKGQSYGQQTYQIATCVVGSRIDLTKAGCALYGASGGPAPVPGNDLVVNGGFESGTTPWTGTTGAITTDTAKPAHSGTAKAWLGGNGRAVNESLAQSVSVPADATKATLTYWVRIDTAETGTRVYDTLKTQVVSAGTTSTLATVSNVDASAGYVRKSVDLTAYKGKSVSIRFAESEDASAQTSFVLDDVSVTAG